MHKCSAVVICFPVLILLLGLAGCDAARTSKHEALGAQFGQDRLAVAVNALGEHVSLAKFPGEFVWVDYAAEWCAACRPQSATIRSLAQAGRVEAVFITVMTSEREGYGHPATQATAARWAQNLSLEPARVVAADLTSQKLPQHALYSPDGRELFRHVGKMSAEEIRMTLERHEKD